MSEPIQSQIMRHVGTSPESQILTAAAFPRIVSALCVDHKSEYRKLENVRCYDDFQDANRFDCATPIVAHAPCRAWSRSFCHQAKPAPGEKELGLKCAEWLKVCGGVLEHPAHSHLFEAAGLPRAGQRIGELVTVEVLQSWWGYELKKRTWFCFSHIDIDALDWPFNLKTPYNNAKRFREMTTKRRSHTVAALAQWLVDAARKCTLPSHALVPQLEPDTRPPIRPQQPLYKLTCEVCGDRFESHREHATTCGPTCRKRKSRRHGLSVPDCHIFGVSSE